VALAASLPEVCGDAALYFDPLQVDDIAEKLVAIASDATLSLHLRDNGVERSKQFTWDACAEKTAAALRESL
jgi:glycosyltransferase involved in cell wall biosynthesis